MSAKNVVLDAAAQGVSGNAAVQHWSRIRDTAASKRADEALRRAEADLARVARLTRMDELAASIAHEINQPLAAAANYLFAVRHLLEGKAEPAGLAVDEALDKASAQMHRAGQIIAHLREFITRGEPDNVCAVVAGDREQAGGGIMHRQSERRGRQGRAPCQVSE